MDKAPAAVDFLFTELGSGLTFARIALTTKTDDAKRIQRNRQNARKAYDSLLHFQGRVSLSQAEKTRLEEGKKELRAALQQLGEKV